MKSNLNAKYIRKFKYTILAIFFSSLIIINLNAFRVALWTSKNYMENVFKLIEFSELKEGPDSKPSLLNESLDGYIVAPKYEEHNQTILRFKSHSYDYWNSGDELPREITMYEHKKLMELVRIAGSIFILNKMEYMIIDGSLLGSKRHWDLVPWDDDFDVLTSIDNRNGLIKYLQTQNDWPNLEWTSNHNIEFNFTYIKLYFKNSVYAGQKHWKFPFIDVLFYLKNSTHIWEENSPKFISPISNIFPLMLRPIGKYWLPSPRNPEGYLNSVNYKDMNEKCIRSDWNHRDEVRVEPKSVDCSKLKTYYPFVETVCDEKFCIETLRLNDFVLEKIIFKKYF